MASAGALVGSVGRARRANGDAARRLEGLVRCCETTGAAGAIGPGAADAVAGTTAGSADASGLPTASHRTAEAAMAMPVRVTSGEVFLVGVIGGVKRQLACLSRKGPTGARLAKVDSYGGANHRVSCR